ncbi:hypothetical protein [Sphingobacterium athyrii]|uniref:Toxin-antitoxin system YwqK family antitoxin n=1 Tax=Sphingobacterium athyrii TaxID=2152717 RepID=A0A363NW77_9SPHI|nr:hypothetical protein [Sphingobacterium athyrii]PUV25007.1 hypothetical protein DCO56_08660 [Sphingobacterium athyrii]
MKQIILLTILIFLGITAYCQEVRKLDDSYFLDLEKFEKGFGILEIKANPENREKEILTLKEGTYFLQNKNQKFWFKINGKHQFTETAKAQITKGEKLYTLYFTFENGLAIATDLKDTSGNLISHFETKDSVFVVKHFRQTGKLAKKIVLRTGVGLSDAVETAYYENGNIKSENDHINKTTRLFYENGKAEYFYHSGSEEKIYFNKNGQKTAHSYYSKDKEWCTEYFENGTIVSKNCNSADHSQKIQYCYKNGKLDYYEVELLSTGEIKKYDKNNKLLGSRKGMYPNTVPNSTKP